MHHHCTNPPLYRVDRGGARPLPPKLIAERPATPSLRIFLDLRGVASREAIAEDWGDMSVRILLALSSLILLAGGAIHAVAYRRFDGTLATVSLPPFYANASRGLWLIDSATQFILAIVFAWIAIRPASASPVVLTLIGLIPAASAVLIYWFLGPFGAAHLLAAAAITTLIAAALSSK